MNQREEEIKHIEENKKNKIEETNKRFKILMDYLDSIKEDKNKLIEFFKNVNQI